MIKSIIKEILIVLLLLVAIALALGVLFYEYIPTNKTVPSVATYTTSESVSNELNEEITGEEQVLVTYEITSTDLNTYTKTKDYQKGKVNPFSTYEETNSSENTIDSTNTNTNTNSSSDANTTTNTYYKNTGTK